MEKSRLGSETARGGFRNEKDIVHKFNNWRNDLEAQEWLQIMGYKLEFLEKVTAVVIPNRISQTAINTYHLSSQSDYNELVKFKKADAQVQLVVIFKDIIKTENISIKKANLNANYNQIDKRSVNTYQEIWGFDDEIANWLKLFTGETQPIYSDLYNSSMVLREPEKRMYISEMPRGISKKIISFFEQNKILVISDILKGRGGLSADWILVTKHDVMENQTDWVLVDINEAMNFYGQGDVEISPRGSIKIGRITLQRKGGTPDPTSMQFKFSPCDLFELRV